MLPALPPAPASAAAGVGQEADGAAAVNAAALRGMPFWPPPLFISFHFISRHFISFVVSRFWKQNTTQKTGEQPSYLN